MLSRQSIFDFCGDDDSLLVFWWFLMFFWVFFFVIKEFSYCVSLVSLAFQRPPIRCRAFSTSSLKEHWYSTQIFKNYLYSFFFPTQWSDSDPLYVSWRFIAYVGHAFFWFPELITPRLLYFLPLKETFFDSCIQASLFTETSFMLPQT